MGVKKAKVKKVKAPKMAKTAISAVSSIISGGRKAPTGKRKRRVTPESLAKKILILRLKKRLYKMKYGGR